MATGKFVFAIIGVAILFIHCIKIWLMFIICVLRCPLSVLLGFTVVVTPNVTMETKRDAPVIIALQVYDVSMAS